MIGILANTHPLPEPHLLTVIRIPISFLLFQVGQRREGSLVVVIAGGIARDRVGARRSSFGGGVFDLIFGWHCFISHVCMYRRVTGLGGGLCRGRWNVGLGR